MVRSSIDPISPVVDRGSEPASIMPRLLSNSTNKLNIEGACKELKTLSSSSRAASSTSTRTQIGTHLAFSMTAISCNYPREKEKRIREGIASTRGCSTLTIVRCVRTRFLLFHRQLLLVLLIFLLLLRFLLLLLLLLLLLHLHHIGKPGLDTLALR